MPSGLQEPGYRCVASPGFLLWLFSVIQILNPSHLQENTTSPEICVGTRNHTKTVPGLLYLGQVGFKKINIVHTNINRFLMLSSANVSVLKLTETIFCAILPSHYYR